MENSMKTGTKMTVRYIFMILTTVILAVIPGFLFSPAALRAAILAICISGSIPLINAAARKRLNEGRPPSWLYILTAAVTAGIIAGCLISLYGYGYPGAQDELNLGLYKNNTPPGFPAITAALAYSVFILGTYHCRWYINTYSVPVTLILLSLAGLIAGAIRLSFITTQADQVLPLMIISLYFALAWGIITMTFDPALSLARWKKIHYA
jgi:hypothetical protein